MMASFATPSIYWLQTPPSRLTTTPQHLCPIVSPTVFVSISSNSFFKIWHFFPSQDWLRQPDSKLIDSHNFYKINCILSSPSIRRYRQFWRSVCGKSRSQCNTNVLLLRLCPYYIHTGLHRDLVWLDYRTMF